MPHHAAGWPSGRDAAAPCSVPMASSTRWSPLVEFPVVAYVEPWVRPSFTLSSTYFSCRWRFFFSSILLLTQRASACCLGLYGFFDRCVVRLVKDVYAVSVVIPALEVVVARCALRRFHICVWSQRMALFFLV
ncbi:uncharacterized protein LOC119296179 [Triticum dicoccoides]|uniref:uncharacterized protein LOC119296179 n=1 Tax=Triticum dicoccoides TaxID=85692 RepID=UPI00188F1468|nr:uncharacterized protein LOC119296179 [Triticum dicoccoides]